MRIKIKHNRLRPKPSNKNKPKISNGDKEFLGWLQHQEYECFVCGGHNGVEWHHVKENSSDTKNHKRLIPLCGEKCHRNGSELSAHGTPRKFREKFSMRVQNGYADEIYKDYKDSLYE